MMNSFDHVKDIVKIWCRDSPGFKCVFCLSLPSSVHIPVLLGSHTKGSWEGMCAP